MRTGPDEIGRPCRMRRVSRLFRDWRDLPPGSCVSHQNRVSTELMTRILVMLVVLAFAGGVARAQTAPTQERPKPRPGVILDAPSTGRITDAPTAKPQQQVSGQTVERFEAVGNSSVASDTIRVYLGIVPGEAYVPDAIQKNFSNLWQTGLFDDIRVEVEPGEAGGVVVKAIVRERPRIGSVEFRGNKELNQTKINE